jgi:hypothetical protein
MEKLLSSTLSKRFHYSLQLKLINALRSLLRIIHPCSQLSDLQPLQRLRQPRARCCRRPVIQMS